MHPATIAQDIPAPRRCFCHLPMEELVGWARKKYLLLSPLAKPGCRILACRDYVKRWLTDMLAMHQASRKATP